ncbi:hypothetical protein ACFWJY_35160 [Streptomyces anulatus]|uniref:hypothetical protein n=1 Tax=Streptomyces anulatus TaxID=1892 RepID=UPI003652DAE5
MLVAGVRAVVLERAQTSGHGVVEGPLDDRFVVGVVVPLDRHNAPGALGLDPHAVPGGAGAAEHEVGGLARLALDHVNRCDGGDDVEAEGAAVLQCPQNGCGVLAVDVGQ